jgi:hypothetical protein
LMHIGFSTMGLGVFGILAGVSFYGPGLPNEFIPKLFLIGFCILLIGFGASHSQLTYLHRKIKKDYLRLTVSGNGYSFSVPDAFLSR